MSFYVKFDGFEYEEIKKTFEKINCKETKILYEENLLQEYIDYLIDRQIKQIKEYNKEYNTNYEECEKREIPFFDEDLEEVYYKLSKRKTDNLEDFFKFDTLKEVIISVFDRVNNLFKN